MMGNEMTDEWHEHLANAWFRSDHVYAGKDHTKENKTFIVLDKWGEEAKSRLPSLDAAIKWADKHLPLGNH